MTQTEEMDQRHAVEAVLFSVGKKISAPEIARIVGCSENACLTHLSALVEDYRSRDSPLVILNEGNAWKMTVREKYLPVVQALIPETELTRSVLETLAVVAWKAPLLQSEVIDIRSTKAYDHIKTLQEQGFLNKVRSGRSYKLTLTQKFLDYFDLKGPEEIQHRFKEYGSIQGLVALFNRRAEGNAEQVKPEEADAPAEEPEQKDGEDVQDSE